MFAEYSGRPGGGRRALPRVVLVSVAPATARSRGSAGSSRGSAGSRSSAASSEHTDFVVSIHEEGTPLTWRRQVRVSGQVQERLVLAAEELQLWAAGLGLTPATAKRTATRLGRDLYRSFLGESGTRVLEALTPTALLLQVDETLVNLPWELMWSAAGPIALKTPFGRVVTTAAVPADHRDPVTEDTVLRILAVANATSDLAASQAELEVITALAGPLGAVTVEVTVLEREQATVGAFRDAVKEHDIDLLHFAGHATFESGDPQASALHLADGTISAQEVADLPWSAPPYVVFNSACESARAGASRRLVSPRGRANGLAAAFLAAGVEAYLGHYWPVGDAAARRFSDVFYRSLFEQRNLGHALLEARSMAGAGFGADADLTAFGAVYFGDPGTAERRDTASMAS